MDPFFQKARPPYIEFEQRPVACNNPAPPLGDGLPGYRQVDFIIITPPGSKDQIELEVVPYLKNLDKLVKDQMFPAQWLEHYRAAYDGWKKDNSFDLNGTPVRVWPAATAAEVKALLAANLRTVEDLAQANEASLARLGMGGRSLKQRAVDWFAAKRDGADLVSRLDASNTALENQQKAMVEMRETISKQAAQLEALSRQSVASPAVSGWPQQKATVEPLKNAQKADDAVIDEMLS